MNQLISIILRPTYQRNHVIKRSGQTFLRSDKKNVLQENTPIHFVSILQCAKLFEPTGTRELWYVYKFTSHWAACLMHSALITWEWPALYSKFDALRVVGTTLKWCPPHYAKRSSNLLEIIGWKPIIVRVVRSKTRQIDDKQIQHFDYAQHTVSETPGFCSKPRVLLNVWESCPTWNPSKGLPGRTKSPARNNWKNSTSHELIPVQTFY